MAVDRDQVAALTQFLGLRTDTPPSKCPTNYSPDCSDMVFSVGGMETRHPFVTINTLPAEIVYRKEFTCKDGTVQVLALDINGVLYTLEPNGTATAIDQVTPGSRCSSVTAYGREYMAFFDDNGGSDAPRQWDGKNVGRVSQGGPGAPPLVTNYSIPPIALVAGSSGAPKTIATAMPINLEQVQTGGGSDDGSGYIPPQYETFYTALKLTTTTPHGLNAGDTVNIAGNTLYSLGTVTVSSVDSPTEFEVAFLNPVPSVGTGGTVTSSAPLLSRTNNIVTATTAAANSLRVGYKVGVSGVTPQVVGGSVTQILIDNDKYPDQATVTTSLAHGLVPGNVITITGVSNVVVGTSIVNIVRNAGISTLTTTTAHGLQPGAVVLVQTGTGPFLPFTVSTVVSPTVFTYLETGLPDTTLTGGSVTLIWPGATETTSTYTVTSVLSPTMFQIGLSYSNGTWTTGTITFDWNGSFYVTSILSATSFQYRQSGPNASIQSGTGTVTPQGQIVAGDHLVYQHFVTRTGQITPPSPPFKFTASGGQYALAQNLSIGPPSTVARLLSFTPVNGSRVFALLIPAQVNGLQISTATRIDDNVTTSALLDFSDLALQSATAVDIPGYNLFRTVTLNTPRGVRWYGDRLGWIGEKNTVLGLINMGMDGGTYSGQSSPQGWNSIGSGVVTQVGFMPALAVTGPDTGEITQSAFQTSGGNAIVQTNQPYSLRFWMLGSGSKVGVLTAKLSSTTAGFTSTATFDLSNLGASGYYTINFDQQMPAAIPSDIIISAKFVGLIGTATYRDLQLIYKDNPNRNPIARFSYVQNPENYDALTGNIGPNNDNTELRALFFLQQNLYFITAKGLHYTQQISNTEPNSWYVDSIADNCGAFNQNSVALGKAWAAWGGEFGAFWLSGGAPEKVTAIIAPTWRNVINITNVYNDQDYERVYFGIIDPEGNKRQIVYDYHEVALGGSGKWSPWRRPVGWTSESSSGTVFAIGAKLYQLSSGIGTSDDGLDDVGGYYIFAPIAASMLQKEYTYLGIEIAGIGEMTPFLYTATLAGTPSTLRMSTLETLSSPVAEWPTLGLKARRLWLKLGQPGAAFSLQNATFVYQADPNAPVSGVR